MSVLNQVRPNIRNLQPYASARDEFEGVAEIYLDANENPFDTAFNRYPDPHQRQLKDKLGKFKRVNPEQIFLGNGSDEAIDLIIRVFCEPGQDNILVMDPTYGMYGVAAAINHITVRKVPLSAEFQLNAENVLNAATDTSKIIFICSPNNPTGNHLDQNEIDTLLKKFKGIVVVDEAYIDFSEQESYVRKLDEFDNLIVLQTFSKAWGLAGLRLGMAFSSSEIIEVLNKVKPPYNVNQLTQKYALEALDDPAQVESDIQTILTQRVWLSQALEKLPGVEHVYPSDGNFLLVRFQHAQPVFTYLMNRGLIVRNRSQAFGTANCLRITVGTEEENKKLISTLKDYAK